MLQRSKRHHALEPWGVLTVDLGCVLIASQDFVTLTLFPLLKKSQLPFLLIFYFSPGIEPQDSKDFE